MRYRFHTLQCCHVAVALTAIFYGGGISSALEQSSSSISARYQFETASIKKSGSVPRVRSSVGPASLVYTGVTLESCILRAYNLQSYQVTGPEWIRTERYQITARTSAPVSRSEMMMALQDLIEKRFRLSFHRESRVIPVYALTSQGDHHGLKASRFQEDSSDVGYAPLPRGWSFNRVSMKEFADILSGGLLKSELPVIDMTGLPGFFDFTLALTSEENSFRLAEDSDLDGSIYRQLGIRVKRTKAPIMVFVIDKASDSPIEN